MKIKSIICIFSLFFYLNAFAQSKIYTPLDTADYQQRKTFLKEFNTRNENLIKSLKSKYSGKTSRELEKFYQEFKKEFEKEIKNKDFSFNYKFQNKLNNILKNLKESNPSIPQNLNILVAKDNTPNAYCLADGTFVINMGIFNWVDNEAQIASILGHEIAHSILEHTIKSLVANINEDKNNKSIAQNIKGSSANKQQKAFETLKNNLYKKHETKRLKEIEADSLGYILFQNTKYNKAEYRNTLNNLNEFDSISPRELKIETYKKLYTLPNQAFKEQWLKKEDFDSYQYEHYQEKLNKDSLSTHPEIVQRIEFLEKKFPELKNIQKAEKGDEEFIQLRKIARMETLPNLYHSEEYGLGIYVAMQFLQDKEEEEYYLHWLGKLFEKIYEARKDYKLNRYLDRIEPQEQNESYQQFLNFMWNLSLSEIKNIAEFYNKKGTS